MQLLRLWTATIKLLGRGVPGRLVYHFGCSAYFVAQCARMDLMFIYASIPQAVKDTVVGSPETASEKTGRVGKETYDSASATAQDAATKAQEAYDGATKPKSTWQVRISCCLSQKATLQACYLQRICQVMGGPHLVIDCAGSEGCGHWRDSI